VQQSRRKKHPLQYTFENSQCHKKAAGINRLLSNRIDSRRSRLVLTLSNSTDNCNFRCKFASSNTFSQRFGTEWIYGSRVAVIPLFPFAGSNLIRFNGIRFRGLSPVGTPTSARSISKKIYGWQIMLLS
jgi:hypothetical protein